MENNNNNFLIPNEIVKKINNNATSKEEKLLNEVEFLKKETRAMQKEILEIKIRKYKELVNRKKKALEILKNSKNILGIDLNSQSSEQLKEKLNKILNVNLTAESILNPESIKQVQKDLEKLLDTKLSLEDILQLKDNFNIILEITLNSQTMDYLEDSFLKTCEIAYNLLIEQQHINNLCVENDIVNEGTLSKAKKFMEEIIPINNGNLNELYNLYYEIEEKVKNIENLVTKINPLKK